MKIAIPVDDKSIKSKVCISFGRTPYFLIFETDTEEGTFLDNNAVASQGGAGIKAAQAIVDAGASVLLTPRCGENAAQVLKAGNVQLYKTINDVIEENIEQYKKGTLPALIDIHPGFHNHGGATK
jgi:predicted Fe-Mo cluster-binding NifX family protein